MQTSAQASIGNPVPPQTRTSASRPPVFSKEQIAQICQASMKQAPARVSFPGGRSRSSCQVTLADGQRIILSRRADARARQESDILNLLGSHQAAAPHLLATYQDDVLIQEEIIGQRLSLRLQQADAAASFSLLGGALGALAKIQQIASQAGLDNQLAVLGSDEAWLKTFLRQPFLIGNALKIPVSRRLDVRQLYIVLQCRTPRFVKWDSRPGNAMVTPHNRVVWFDWEHAGARNRLDDMAWLLGDEFTPDNPLVERELIKRFLPHFADDLNGQEAMRYLMAYGTFHLVVRLGLILKNKGDNDWWDPTYCLEQDKIGVTLECAQRLCSKGSRWAQTESLLQPLAGWFEKVSKELETL
ncbi:phosphotransferase [Candidatus Thiothrix sp. Deng01]|uniref:Phosphotransferase n=1 Tax=Candidatus Thiothrix phosphatis TaxID=3112415 RepID=A0ABU6CUA9_9GAMM|nr:phosphotransferase [Candidatus Thiothrix sp. Deng01]MEB4589958.1 phosphotransferase [Candidatus Thiothrix sp. Deng01]